MNLNEALAWLRGERSLCNSVPQDPFETWQVRVAQADAAVTQQAYWIAKAHHEGLVQTDEALTKEAELAADIIGVWASCGLPYHDDCKCRACFVTRYVADRKKP